MKVVLRVGGSQEILDIIGAGKKFKWQFICTFFLKNLRKTPLVQAPWSAL